MPKAGELEYLRLIGEAGVMHAVHKPYSDVHCGDLLIVLGWLRNLLPTPPARLLDLGCGTGWTSCHLAKMGYDVTGQDIAPDMIKWANHNKAREQLSNVHFKVCDYEDMPYSNEFEAALFFDSLHHAENEYRALEMTYQALMPGGVCLTREPGEGHSENPHSVEAMQKFQVTEKDMPPHRIAAMARQIGFREVHIYPNVDRLLSKLFHPRHSVHHVHAWRALYSRVRIALHGIRGLYRLLGGMQRSGGIVRLVK